MGQQSWLRNIITSNQLTLQHQHLAGGVAGGSLTDQSVSNAPGERYDTDYYAGNQVSIFLGDLWLDDITMVQFHAQQNKRPFYGYKSQRWDTVAMGTQIVDGVFSMNYTHTNYLNMAVAYYLKKQANPINTNDSTVNVTEVQQFIADAKRNPALLNNLSYSVSGNPLGPNTQQGSKFNSMDFSDKAALLEEYLWGGTKNKELGENEVINPDNLPGFDIVISFGNYPQDRQGGGPDELISSHTVKIINDVRILSHSIQAAVTGEPVQEVYTFIARGVDTPLTRSPLPYSTPANVQSINGPTAGGDKTPNQFK